MEGTGDVVPDGFDYWEIENSESVGKVKLVLIYIAKKDLTVHSLGMSKILVNVETFVFAI